jgi:hypothetical protein
MWMPQSWMPKRIGWLSNLHFAQDAPVQKRVPKGRAEVGHTPISKLAYGTWSWLFSVVPSELDSEAAVLTLHSGHAIDSGI